MPPAPVAEPPASLTLEEALDSAILLKHVEAIAHNTMPILMPEGPQRGLPPEE